MPLLSCKCTRPSPVPSILCNPYYQTSHSLAMKSVLIRGSSSILSPTGDAGMLNWQHASMFGEEYKVTSTNRADRRDQPSVQAN